MGMDSIRDYVELMVRWKDSLARLVRSLQGGNHHLRNLKVEDLSESQAKAMYRLLEAAEEKGRAEVRQKSRRMGFPIR